MNNFQLRFFSSIILFVPIFFLFNDIDIIFLLVILAILSLSLWEFFRLIDFRNYSKFQESSGLSFLLGRQKISFLDIFTILKINILAILFFFISDNLSSFILVIFTLIYFAFFLRNDPYKLLGLIYLSSPFYILMYFRQDENFETHLFFILYFAILTDISSYFAGKIFGGKKIFPKISAGKTIAGSIGGILIPTFTSVLLFVGDKNIFLIILTSIFLSIIVQLGDFLESYFKRYCNVKDSSNLIPGHGGVLDRLDGFFLLIVIIFIIKLLNFNLFFLG